MTPFLQFRLWLRRSSASNKAGALIAALMLAGLTVWAALPSSSSTTTASDSAPLQNLIVPQDSASPAALDTAPATDAAAPQPTDPTSQATPPAATPTQVMLPVGPSSSSRVPAPTPTSKHPVSASKTASPSASKSPSAAGGITCAAIGAPIKVGVLIAALGSAGTLNAAFGIPSPADQQRSNQAMFDYVNATPTKAACHPLTPDFQTFDEINSTSSAQSVCLQLAQDKVFALLGSFQPRASDACLLQHHIPTFSGFPLMAANVKQFYPYYFSARQGELDTVFKNFAHATADMGYYTAAKSFTKAGIFYRDCVAGEYDALVADLKAVGVTQISSFNVGCPTAFATPAQISQAVSQFQTVDHVSTVIPIDAGDLPNFTKQAQQQGYKPQYLLPDDTTVTTTGPSSGSPPDPTNFNGAVAITPTQLNGLLFFPEDDTSKRCDKIMTAAGRPGAWDGSANATGVICNSVWILVAALENAPSLTPESLAAGLQKAKSVPLAYPDGPNDYTKDPTAGGQYWRAATYESGCTCWHPMTSQFHAPY